MTDVSDRPLSKTSARRQIAIVAVGYLASLLLAALAVAVHIALTSGADANASSGMYAFGDALLFVFVFGGCALVPTAAALYFLRPYRRFWVAAAGVASIIA